MNDLSPLTSTLADYAVDSSFDALPRSVRHEASRALLNWLGVAIAGSGEEAAEIAARSIGKSGGRAEASVIGQGFKTDVASAAFVNCIASSVLAYDDAVLPSVAHPSGPAVAAMIAIAQARRVSGPEFVNAVALGIELQCRVANMLALAPSNFHPSLYMNGFSGPIGVAAAVGRLLELDRRAMSWAIGLAASQASGFRATHGTMTAHFRPGHATRAGISAALMASDGFDCTEDSLEAPGGFLDVYASQADPSVALAALGTEHVMLTNRYKPYPCGIVIHPIIDACLDARRQAGPMAWPARIDLTVHPAALRMTGKRAPRTPLESHVSLFHWAAVALLRNSAGMAASSPEALSDPEIAKLREEIVATASDEFDKGEAAIAVTLGDGRVVRAHVRSARGSLDRPLTDDELVAKFEELTACLVNGAAERLKIACWNLAELDDVGATIGALLP